MLAICFFSPLQALAMTSFSMHMSVHVILLLLVGPCMILGLSSTHRSRQQRFFRWLKDHAWVSWVVGMGTMWIWHIPVIFNSGMRSMAAQMHHGFNWTHFAEAVSLVLAGTIYSAPVIHPVPECRLGGLKGIIYLVTACTGCSVLGLLITFAPPGIYRFNEMMEHAAAISPVTDQQIAGLIMWVPCCFVYISGAIYIMAGWLNIREKTIVS